MKKRKNILNEPQPLGLRPARDFAAVLALVFFSGFAALVYEILWFRQLGLVFGNTAQAAATVLAAFMLGLAWGAHRARRWVLHMANPLRFFGALEAGIGLYAIVGVPAAFALVHLCYREAAQAMPQAVPLLTGLRFVLALLALLLPTTLMGATLPVVAEAVLRTREHFASRMGWLYGSNTAGATLGVLACGFLLVPALGVRASNLTAAAINLLVGGAAYMLSRAAMRRTVPAAPLADKTPSPSPKRLVGLLLVAALCGFLALAFETVWFRALILIFGSTTYSFAIMVAVFLVGIALGSAALGRLADQPRRAAWALAGTQAGIGLWTLLSLRFYDQAPEWLLGALVHQDFTWGALLWAKAALAAAFLMPLAVLSGLAFTAAVRLVRDRTASSGRAVSMVFSVNSLGSALGAVVAGFVLLPGWGIERTLLILGGGGIALGLAVVLGAIQAPWPRRLAVATVVVAAAVGLRLHATRWDPLILSSGAYFTPRTHVSGNRVTLRNNLRSLELLHYQEGKTATVAVTRTPDGRLLFSSNGKTEADTSDSGMSLQRLQGHIPMLLHPKPQRVLNIGLGAGVTAGAVRCYPDVHLDVVDIEPAATNVASVWAKQNHDLIRRGGFNLVVNDGRNHLLVTTNRYDVITSDPFEPVVAGAASLYTVEHFRLARSRLAPGGLMAQFLPLYELSQQDVLIIMRSFLRVFPRSAIFFTGVETILLGLTDEAHLNFGDVGAKMEIPAVRESLAEIGVERPEGLLGMLVADLTAGDVPVQDGPVNTDDRPRIEYSAPKSTLEYWTDVNQKVLLMHFRPIPDAYLAQLEPAAAAAAAREHEGLQTLLRGCITRSSGDFPGSLKLLSEAMDQAPANPIVRTELTRTLAMLAQEARAAGRTNEAVARYTEVLQLDPKYFWALHNLVPLVRASQPELAEELLRRGMEAYPGSGFFLALRGRCRGEDGDVEGACRDLEAALQVMPLRYDVWDDYAHYLGLAGRRAEADAAAKRAQQAREW